MGSDCQRDNVVVVCDMVCVDDGCKVNWVVVGAELGRVFCPLAELPVAPAPLELLASLEPLELPASLEPLELPVSLVPLELLASPEPLEPLDVAPGAFSAPAA